MRSLLRASKLTSLIRASTQHEQSQSSASTHVFHVKRNLIADYLFHVKRKV